jgi:hypothetical protein
LHLFFRSLIRELVCLNFILVGCDTLGHSASMFRVEVSVVRTHVGCNHMVATQMHRRGTEDGARSSIIGTLNSKLGRRK